MMRNSVWNRTYRYLRTNPGNAFIIAFEALLIGVATEVWTGNNQVANQLGVIAFILAFLGVGLQTLASIRSR